MKLDPDLQRILNVGAKIYNTEIGRQGKIYSNNEIDIMVDYGKGDSETYSIEEFKELLITDIIVSNSRVTIGAGDKFKIKPRVKEAQPTPKTNGTNVRDTNSFNTPKETPIIDKNKLETGYVNFKMGKFSTDPKKGYTKIEYRKSTQKVTLELDDDQLSKLKELGIV